MSKSFVRIVSEKLLSDVNDDGLKDCLVVIPSQRIGLHLKKELSGLLSKSIFLPEIITIDNFLTQQFNKVSIDNISIFFELYLSYTKVFPQPESFDSFLNWAPQIISDFSEIDKYLLESKDVFRNLKSIKEIESWSFNADELTETQKKFMEFWEHLGQLYDLFHKDLSEKGLTTNSNIYKTIALNPIQYITKLNYKKIYIIGFNALATSESMIFKYLVNSNLAEIIWDADPYYLNDKEQEAGLFLRKNMAWSNNKPSNTQNILTNPKHIFIHAANSNLDQTHITSKILDNNHNFQTSKSAVIFSDESLLRPMLNVLPENIDKLNVAMGYPLQSSSAFTLLDQLFDSLKNISRYKQKSSLYYKDYELIFHHELVQPMLENWNVKTKDIELKINKQNFTYLPKDVIADAFGKSFDKIQFLFYDTKISISELTVFVSKFFEDVRNFALETSSDLIEQEALFVVLTSLKKMAVLLEKYPYVNSPESLLLLIKKVIKSSKISFFGEPLQGLQMLGLLETRGLDFENLILLSCNEDILPASSFSQSLMPYDLRNYLGLPNKEDKEAMYAYYFYRLLHCAKNVHLVYNAGAPDGMSTNEISRYLLQIRKELVSDNIKITEVQAKLPNTDRIGDVFEDLISKNEFQTRVNQLLNQGLSASSINNFKNCPRDFFFNYILRHNDSERVEEHIESSTFGTIVHEVLEQLYKDAGKIITKDLVIKMLSSFESNLKEVFERYFPSGNFQSGKNLLQYETAKYSIKKFLNSELDFIEKNGAIEIIGLEMKLEKVIAFEYNNIQYSVKLKGSLDRIDKVGDTIRIIDYKTGKINEKFHLKEEISKMTDKSFQLLFYAYLFFENPNQKMMCGMISMKELNKGVQFLYEDKKEEVGIQNFSTELMENFEYFIQEFVIGLLESDYQHKPSSMYCSIC